MLNVKASTPSAGSRNIRRLFTAVAQNRFVDRRRSAGWQQSFRSTRRRRRGRRTRNHVARMQDRPFAAADAQIVVAPSLIDRLDSPLDRSNGGPESCSRAALCRPRGRREMAGWVVNLLQAGLLRRQNTLRVAAVRLVAGIDQQRFARRRRSAWRRRPRRRSSRCRAPSAGLTRHGRQECRKQQP